MSCALRWEIRRWIFRNKNQTKLIFTSTRFVVSNCGMNKCATRTTVKRHFEARNLTNLQICSMELILCYYFGPRDGCVQFLDECKAQCSTVQCILFLAKGLITTKLCQCTCSRNLVSKYERVRNSRNRLAWSLNAVIFTRVRIMEFFWFGRPSHAVLSRWIWNRKQNSVELIPNCLHKNPRTVLHSATNTLPKELAKRLHDLLFRKRCRMQQAHWTVENRITWFGLCT